jgi:LAO/AO transport system kinase
MEYTEEEIRTKFLEKAKNGKITCVQALSLARELNFPTNQVAPLLTEMGIKIHKCQLGCFP